MKLIVDKGFHDVIPSADYPPRADSNICPKINQDGTSAYVLYSDDVWDFSFYDLTKTNSSGFKINFNVHPKKFIDDIKYRVYHILFPNTEKHLGDRKNVSLPTVRHNISSISKVTRQLELMGVTLQHLQHKMIFDTLCERLRELDFAVATYEGLLTSLTWITEANPFIEEKRGIYLPAFKRNELAKQLSSKEKGSQHPIIIPEVMSGLYSYFIDMVDTWHDRRHELKDIEKFSEDNNISHFETQQLRRKLTAIGYAVIMAFTGMRVSEATAIQPDSFNSIEFDGIYFYTIKTQTVKLEHGIPRTDVWCCAPICEKAINIIFDIWDRVHIQDNPNTIESYNFGSSKRNLDGIKSKAKLITLSKTMIISLTNLLSEEVRWPFKEEWRDSYNKINLRTGERLYPIKEDSNSLWWHFSNHTFRRTFAHFAVGTGTSSVASIKQQFKHVCISMTGIYTRDSEILTILNMEKDASLMKEIEDAKMSYDSNYLTETLSEKATSSGGFRDKVLGTQQPQVYTEEQFNELQSHSLTASKSTGFGRCFSKEECSMRHLFEPSGCVSTNCEGLSINHSEASRWQIRHKDHCEYLGGLIGSGMYSSNQYSRYILDIRAAEKVMADHNINFDRFKVSI